MSETPEGFLLCLDVSIARTGEMVYGDGETPVAAGPDGKVLIMREEKEVFRPETMASFEGKSVTVTHPKEFVDTENFKELEKGTVQNVRRGTGEAKNDLVADLLIKDGKTIKLVKDGLREVSCGYEAEYTEIEPGKGFQSNIIGNHVALVDQGRAGSSYAINDHKGVNAMKFKDKVKSIFTKAQDEALKVLDEAGGPDVTSKNESAEAAGKGYDSKSIDELVESVKDLMGKLEEKKAADAEGEASGGQATKKQKPAVAGGKGIDEEEELVGDEEKVEAKDDLQDLLAKFESLSAEVAELKKCYAGDEEMCDDEEEMEDDDFEESSMTGDSASRAEILAPGIKRTKDMKVKALETAFATKDGKTVIEVLTGGKKPDFKNQKTVDHLFIAASEMLKIARSDELKKTKTFDTTSSPAKGAMTPEEMNKMNEQFYGKK